MKNLLILLFLFSTPVLAQKADLFAKSGDKGLYLEHKVLKSESFFSIGRKYNVNPRAIADYNKLDINKGLNIDQKLRIPLTDTNFSQEVNGLIPVYYKAGEKDDLERISKSFKNVSLDHLKAWNKIAEGGIKKDQKIIIGYMVTAEAPSTVIVKPADVIKSEKPPEKDIINTVVRDTVAVAKPEDPRDAVQKKEEEFRKTETIVSKTEVKAPIPGEGFFKKFFDQQVKKFPVSRNATVTAGIFKTASGWQDEKFYLLIDGVPPGSIIRISNPVNNKVIYAKVLGGMSGIRQNEGLNIRISNAGAAALEITEQDKFIVQLSY